MAIPPLKLQFPTINTVYGACREFPFSSAALHLTRASSVLIAAYFTSEHLLASSNPPISDEEEPQPIAHLDERFIQLLVLLEASETQPIGIVHTKPLLDLITRSIPRCAIPDFDRTKLAHDYDLTHFKKLFKHLKETYKEKYALYLRTSLQTKISQVFQARASSLSISSNSSEWVQNYKGMEEPKGALHKKVLSYMQEYYHLPYKFSHFKTLNPHEIDREKEALSKWILKEKCFVLTYDSSHTRRIEACFEKIFRPKGS